MVDTERIILTVLAIVGLVFVGFIIYYFIRRWLEHEKTTGQQFPPPSLMEMSEAQCPDYWINSTGLNSSSHKCVNKFDIPVNKSSSGRCANVSCTDPDGKSKMFSTLKVWGDNENRDKIRERCLWRDCCGPQENIPASWVGIAGTCGY